jgi:hypothetical protein
MKAQRLRRLTSWSEWIMAGSLSLASSAFLLALLVMVGRLGAPARVAAGRPGDSLSRVGAECIFAAARPQPAWPELEVAVAPCLSGLGTSGPEGTPASVVLCRLGQSSHYASAGTDATGSLRSDRAQSIPLAVSVVLGWLLSLALLARPSWRPRPVRYGPQRPRLS